jgi:hypothetical protein
MCGGGTCDRELCSLHRKREQCLVPVEHFGVLVVLFELFVRR